MFGPTPNDLVGGITQAAVGGKFLIGRIWGSLRRGWFGIALGWFGVIVKDYLRPLAYARGYGDLFESLGLRRGLFQKVGNRA